MEKKTAKVSYMFQFYKLLLRKSMTSTFFGFRRLRLSDTNWPAFENSLSIGTEEPGMQRYLFCGMHETRKSAIILIPPS